jgi:hypothetical protein
LCGRRQSEFIAATYGIVRESQGMANAL